MLDIDLDRLPRDVDLASAAGAGAMALQGHPWHPMSFQDPLDRRRRDIDLVVTLHEEADPEPSILALPPTCRIKARIWAGDSAHGGRADVSGPPGGTTKARVPIVRLADHRSGPAPQPSAAFPLGFASSQFLGETRLLELQSHSTT